jgi:prepilin-type N-terminal cleavage/methylation domain-containing protein
MNSVFTAKLLQNLRNKKSNKGFTLIELLVVVIIIGVLAAVALPNLLGQVAKGRQAEAKNNLGAINRAQQAYRLEEGTFGDYDAGNLSTTIQITGEFYDYAGQNDGTNPQQYAFHTATALAAFDDDILNYESAVGQTAAGDFETVICESSTPVADDASTNNTAGDVDCDGGSPI